LGGLGSALIEPRWGELISAPRLLAGGEGGCCLFPKNAIPSRPGHSVLPPPQWKLLGTPLHPRLAAMATTSCQLPLTTASRWLCRPLINESCSDKYDERRKCKIKLLHFSSILL